MRIANDHRQQACKEGGAARCKSLGWKANKWLTSKPEMASSSFYNSVQMRRNFVSATAIWNFSIFRKATVVHNVPKMLTYLISKRIGGFGRKKGCSVVGKKWKLNS